MLSFVALGVLALVAFETAVVLVLVPDSSFRWWALGVFQSVAVGAGLHLTNAAFIAHERDAIYQLRGAWGEEATREALKAAKRRRLIWGWVDSVALRAGDLDHVVVARNGGLLVIDSKWRSTGGDAASMATSAAKARLRAEGVARTLLRSERGSHRERGQPIGVQPLVVIWGPAQHTVPDGCVVNGIPFVGGRRLVSWLRALDSERVSKSAATEFLSELKTFRASTHEAENRRRR